MVAGKGSLPTGILAHAGTVRHINLLCLVLRSAPVSNATDLAQIAENLATAVLYQGTISQLAEQPN